ncbi:hypothetical protein KFE25_007711 [Diacronema lutheri]|uniref:Cyclic nucleotide-binding domain-containing protein n=1 Tax=Diacronema lutheri TaxID=2081491 RepID=A0A8J6CIT5_DIALT|nr:hypothetical protein KFE25_007711 [Diacronema lutheri]
MPRPPAGATQLAPSPAQRVRLQVDDDEVEVKTATPRGLAFARVGQACDTVRDFLLCARRAKDTDDDDDAPKKQDKNPKLRGILRRAPEARKNREHIKWRTVLVGEENDVEDSRARLQAESEERERRQRWQNLAKLARLPALTLEELLIPLRIAFPSLTVATPLAIVLDVFIDTFEIAWIVKTVREQPTPEQRKALAAAAESSEQVEKTEEYTAAHVMRDCAMAVSLHLARGIFIIAGDNTLWTLVQVLRAMRVRELLRYVNHINNDLGTNVKFLAVYKFSLVMISFKVLSGNASLDPSLYSAWHHYLMSLYMSWGGLTSMGYATLVITTQQEIIFAAIVAMVQMVFYAFVLGTLLHYLVRTNESTVHFNELMKAVDEYVSARKLPPELCGKIRAHYAFQHRKQAAGTDRIFAQMPLSMRTEVAVAQHDRQMHATWVFWNCTPQFLSYLALFLRERYMMPAETLFKRGDGAGELLWCVRGSLHVTKGDTHITTIRSDLGPGQIVGEIAFFIGIQQPYTVVASTKGEVTLVVLSSASFDEIIGSYPEQTDQITQNVLRKYSLDKKGADLAGGGFQEQMDEDELKEFEELRGTIRTAILEHNEELFAQMGTAVKQGDVETVRAMIARGFDLSLGSYDKRKPLHLAALEGHKTIVRVLCELGASVNDVDRFGSTPIKNAIDEMHGTVAEELAAHGARLTLARPASRMHAAAKEGDMASMTMLVAHGIDINCANCDGRTALHVAAHEGNARVAEYLISNMADVAKRDRWNRSPLDDAIEHNHALVAQMLVRNSARPDAELMAKLLRAASADGDTERLRFLLEMGVVIDATDYDRRSALHYAVRSGSLSAAHLLVCALADVNIADRWLRPPLVDALEVSGPIASVLAQQCGAALPESVASDAHLAAALRDARAADMYELNRQIAEWAASAKRAHALQLDKAREVEMAFTALADDLSSLAGTQRSLFRGLNRVTDLWISEYGEDGDSDDEADVGDANLKDVADDVDADSDKSSDDGKAGGEGGADGGGKRDERDGHGNAASQFIKLVLQLPSAEAGLAHLRALFAAALSPVARKELPEPIRRKEEDTALRELLAAEFTLGETIAQQVVAEIYHELRNFLGNAAPKGPEQFEWLAQHMKSHTQTFAAAARVHAEMAEVHTDDSMAPSSAAHETRAQSVTAVTAVTAAAADSGMNERRGSNSREIVRRGSNTGANLVDFSAQLGERTGRSPDSAGRRASGSVRDAVGRRVSGSLRASGVRGGRAGGKPSKDAGAGAGAGAGATDGADADADSSVFLSDLGHVVLLCSRKFIDALAHQHTAAAAAAQARGAKPGQHAPLAPTLAAGAPATEAPAAGARGSATLGQRVMRISFTSKASAFDGRVSPITSTRPLFRPNRPSRLSDESVAAAAPPSAAVAARADGAAQAASVGKAMHVILRLFSIFDKAGAGQIHVRDVKRLQGELGELGSDEIKSLVSYLMKASRSFALPENTVANAHAPFQGQRRESRSNSLLSGALAQRRNSGSYARRESVAVPGILPYDEATGAGGPMAIGGRRKRRSLNASRSSLSDLTAALEKEARDAADEAIGARPAHAAPPVVVKQPSVGPAPADADEAAPAGDEPTPAASELDGRSIDRAVPPGADADAGAPPADADEADDDVPLFARAEPAELAAIHPASAVGATNALQPRSPHASPVTRSRTTRSMSEVQFFVGVSSWIMLTTGNDADEADEADEADAGTPGQRAGGAIVPRLSGARALSGAEVPAIAVHGHAHHAKSKAAARQEAAARAARDEQTLRDLDGALDTVGAYSVLADNLQLRIDTSRLDGKEVVTPEMLLALLQHMVMIPPSTTPEMAERWCRRRLGLTLRAGADVDQSVDDADADGSDAGSDGGGHRAARLLLLGADEQVEAARDATWADLLKALRARAGAIAAADGTDAAQRAGGKGGALYALLRIFGLAGSRASALDDAAAADEGDGALAERPWYIISYKSPYYGYTTTAFLLLVTLDLLLIPLLLAFIDQTKQMGWVFTVNTVADLLYLVRIAIRLNTTFINEKSVEVFRPSEVRQQYLHGDFVLDIIASWPHNLLAAAFNVEPIVMLSLRVFRLINCRYTLAAFGRWKAMLGDADFAGGLVKNLVPLFFTIHYSACVWNVIGFNAATRHQLGGFTWADAYLLQRDAVTTERVTYTSLEAMMMDQYVISLFFVLSIISALGVAQLPANLFEFGAFVILCCVNTTIYAWCVGGISGLVMKQDDEIVGKRAQLELVHAYVRHIHVPNELKERMTKFFQQRLQHASLSSVDADDIYAGLPIPLQMEVAAHTNRALVGACSLLRGCLSGFLDRLSSALRERELDAETVVFRSGDACKELLLISAGVIETADDDEDGRAEEGGMVALGAGDTLGEVPFVFGIRHFKTARVGRTKASAFTLTVEAYRELLKSFPAQEDVIMDNTMRQYDGMATSRSGKSKSSNAQSSHIGSLSRSEADGRSEAGRSNATGAHDGATGLQKILSDAKRKREQLVEAERARAAADAVAARDAMVMQVSALHQWVREEREAARTLKAQLEKMARVEAEMGAVLADEHPELWEHIYAYAEGYFDWKEEALRRVQPMVNQWVRETRSFALVTAQKLRSKLADVLLLSETDAKPVERLYEVTFRKPVKVDGR